MMVIKGYRVWPLLKQVGKEIWQDNILTIGAAVAYNFFFSLFPLLLFAAPLLGLVGNKREMFEWILSRLADTVPPAAFAPLQAVVRDVVFAPNAPGLVSIGAVLTLYSASNIFGSLMNALNIAYDVKQDKRSWWQQRLIQLAMVIVVGLLTTIAALVMVAGPNIVNAGASALHLGAGAKWVWMILQYPLAFSFLVLALWLIYYALPNLRQHKTQILIGAVSAALLWVLATMVFRAYVVHFNKFNAAYGTIGAVLLLLTWMYYSMVVVLAGGELNSELAKGTAAVNPRRGAVYEGRIVTAQRPARPSTDRIESIQQPRFARSEEE
jgi:membrane protein